MLAYMRLGGKIFTAPPDPEAWVAAHAAENYRAAYCPVSPGTDPATVRAYREAADKADLVIAEVGAWSNCLAPDEAERRRNVRRNIEAFALAEEIGAVCCVNIPGSRNPDQWNGPHAGNYTDATFQLIVDTVREIIDTVEPRRSCYCLEMMGWGIPDSAESYLDLIRAVDRAAFGVHFDPVNLVCSPRRYFANSELIRHTVRTLGPTIRSVHGKDVALGGRHLVHLDECRPGTGNLDFDTLFKELSLLSADLPFMLEHLPNAEEYKAAAAFVRAKAEENGVTL